LSLDIAPTQAPSAVNIDQDYYQLVGRDADLAFLDNLSKPRPSRGARFAEGKELRKQVPRSSHAEYRPPPQRPDPVAVLQAQNERRIAELVPLRMQRMASSPFAFMRGAAALMAADLAASPATDLEVMACGDMHLLNFGLFASAERNLVFAINDFDEVHPAPWEWDLKRLAASAVIAAEFVGGTRDDGEAAARAAVQSYVRRIARFAEMGFLETWYELIDEQEILAATAPGLRRVVEETMLKARAKGHQRGFDRLTEKVGGERRFVEERPIIVRETHLPDGTPIAQALGRMMQGYFNSLPEDRRRLLSRYRIVDAARKVVGVGSIGTNCWVMLLEGLDEADPLFLQVKEAGESVLAPYARTKLPITNQGERVVVGQRMIQGSPDIFLGWGRGAGTFRDLYVRQLADMKGGENIKEGDRDFLARLPGYCALCGWALAMAHAKSGDAARIAGYCGRSDALAEAIGKYALAYADQNEKDHAALVRAIKQGRVSAAEV
jgi:uncharacterized protein (DUF2252 family)